jgi:hypothetical protein
MKPAGGDGGIAVDADDPGGGFGGSGGISDLNDAIDMVFYEFG